MRLDRRAVLGGGLSLGWSGFASHPGYAAQEAARPLADAGRRERVPGGAGRPLPEPSAAAALRARRQFATAIGYARSTGSDALLIWRNGGLILDERFRRSDRPVRTWSASMMKTVVALLVGVAIERGDIRDVEQPASDFLHEWRGDERAKITIRDLLAMASGLDHPSAAAARDGVREALGLRLVDRPGAVFDYNTRNVILLMELLSRATGRRVADFLSRTLWKPLGCRPAMLALDDAGAPSPNILASAEDWMRIGVLLLQRGRWDGRRLVDAAWIERMLTPSATNPGYGFLTWIGSPPGDRRSYGPKVQFQAIHSAPFLASDLVYLDGFGGQRVYVAPSRALVIVRTGATRADFDDAVIPNAVVAAL